VSRRDVGDALEPDLLKSRIGDVKDVLGMVDALAAFACLPMFDWTRKCRSLNCSISSHVTDVTDPASYYYAVAAYSPHLPNQ
jgi:hypothetical protein